MYVSPTSSGSFLIFSVYFWQFFDTSEGFLTPFLNAHEFFDPGLTFEQQTLKTPQKNPKNPLGQKTPARSKKSQKSF